MDEEHIELSDLPRFTRAALREIFIPEGGTGTTLAKYTFRRRGRKIEKLARLDDLTAEERAAALSFILEHGAGVRIRKKDTPPMLDKLPEFEPLPDDLTDAAGSRDPADDPVIPCDKNKPEP